MKNNNSIAIIIIIIIIIIVICMICGYSFNSTDNCNNFNGASYCYTGANCKGALNDCKFECETNKTNKCMNLCNSNYACSVSCIVKNNCSLFCSNIYIYIYIIVLLLPLMNVIVHVIQIV